MEAILIAWLIVAAILLGPPLLGVHRSTWPLESEQTADVPSSDAEPTAVTPTPVGRCRVCGEDGQAGFTYCQSCLTPLPQDEEGAAGGSRDGHPAD
ncbi:hypothetical protein HWV07_07895 [Natronomonas salina]|uniref:hypothetical protein n=1 Tax=Natronomonas salina TaxID=1710540 RepID=UPI0015B42FC0|nr:hypothetical protein [Natronomonas salina]QLD88955.1 hypothetical protein HWV07_07895 [Natronomonas salina]